MFGLKLVFQAIGLVAVLFLPTWIGLVYVMAKRSREGYFVDITSQGVSIGMPADHYFIKREDLTRVTTAPFFPAFPSLCIHSGRQCIVVRKLIKTGGLPEKKPLKAWLTAKAPDRKVIRQSMMDLKRDLEALIKS